MCYTLYILFQCAALFNSYIYLCVFEFRPYLVVCGFREWGRVQKITETYFAVLRQTSSLVAEQIIFQDFVWVYRLAVLTIIFRVVVVCTQLAICQLSSFPYKALLMQQFNSFARKNTEKTSPYRFLYLQYMEILIQCLLFADLQSVHSNWLILSINALTTS